jgi:two-component system, chemotaxis family, protein-glutamate methylesterase/glutaminase
MAQDGIIERMVVIGGSAGSLEVVLRMFSALPQHTGASFIIVFHRKNTNDSILTELLGLRTKMNVLEVEDKEPILPDSIYIAPPDYHLLLEDEKTFALDSSEKVQFSRPSIDVTMESVAEVYGRKAIGILLSGANADGAKGLQSIKDSGGIALVQDPSTAEVGFMPAQAVSIGAFSEIVDGEQLGPRLAEYLKGSHKSDKTT